MDDRRLEKNIVKFSSRHSGSDAFFFVWNCHYIEFVKLESGDMGRLGVGKGKGVLGDVGAFFFSSLYSCGRFCVGTDDKYCEDDISLMIFGKMNLILNDRFFIFIQFVFLVVMSLENMS